MTFDIKQLIDNAGVETLMQLVISPNKDYAAGIEALSRGVDPQTGMSISPLLMIREAKKAGLELELEELMLNKALETFQPIYQSSPDLLLFINIGMEFIELCLDNDVIDKAVAYHGIPPSNIFFDIIAFDVNRISVIKKFVDRYRERNYYICVDDLGLDYYNIDKVLYLSPDLVKINIRALRQLENQDYVKKMTQTLKLITESLGIILVAKGIEDEEDVTFSFDTGTQFMQGFYISKPIDLTFESLQTIKNRYRNLIAPRLHEEEATQVLTRKMSTKAYGIIKGIRNTLEIQDQCLSEDYINTMFDQYPMIETLWFLDEKGKQHGQTLTNFVHYKTKNTSMFQVHNDGSDFSTKDLFSQLYDTILEVWVTPPFKSILTNNRCITCSIRIDRSPQMAVLCLNINLDQISIEEKTLDLKADEEFKIMLLSDEEHPNL